MKLTPFQLNFKYWLLKNNNRFEFFIKNSKYLPLFKINLQIAKMSLYQQFSEVKLKKQVYYKQIRAKKRQDYFAAQRKLLLQGQCMSQFIPGQTSSSNNIVINSLHQLQSHLSTSPTPNYLAIITYLQHSQHPFSSHLLTVLMEKSTTKQFLKNQHALVLLIKLINMKGFDFGYWMNEEKVKFYVGKVIQFNLVLEDTHHMIWKLDYFATVCWLLFIIATQIQDKTLMMPIQVHLKMMQYQSFDPTTSPFTFIYLLSQLSTCPQLLPSQQFIYRLLSYQLHPTQPQSQTPQYQSCIVNLLDNYIRYQQCQPLHRFQYQDSIQLAINYLKYATLKVKQLKFPNKLKVELISLVNTIVRAASDDVLEELFNIPQSRDLCEQLFYRAEYGEWQAKSASFQCFSEIICQQILLPRVTQYMDPYKITHLYVNSMILPDRQLQQYALACIHRLLQTMPQVYKKCFRQSDYQKRIIELQFTDRKSLENGQSNDSICLADYARFIFDSYIHET